MSPQGIIMPPSVAASPAVAPPRIRSAEIYLNTDSSLTGRPTHLDAISANVGVEARYDVQAPAGSQIHVDVPAGAKLNTWVRINQGTDGVSLARDGAGYTVTAPRDIAQLTISSMHFNGQSPNIAISDHDARVGDVLPRLSVNGVPQAARPDEITVFAPVGWQTRAADGSIDPLTRIAEVDGSVFTKRDPAKGVATTAQFTGQFNGHSTVGIGRAAHEATERAGTAAAKALYLGLMLTGGVG